MEINYVQKAILEVVGFEELHEDFIKRLTISGLSNHTVSNYARSIAQIAVYFKKSPLELTDKELRDYLFYLKSKENSKSMFKFAIYSLRKLYQLNRKRKLKTQLPSIPQRPHFPLVLSFEECKQIISAPLKLRDRFLLAFLYSSGLRISELANLKLEDLNTRRMEIRIIEGKGNKSRIVPMSRFIAEKLPKYLEICQPETYLFNSTRKSKKFAHETIQRIVREAKKKAGINKNVTTHTFRHTFATHLLENGVNLLTIKKVLGHASIQTTLVYLHVAQAVSGKYVSPLDVLYNK